MGDYRAQRLSDEQVDQFFAAVSAARRRDPQQNQAADTFRSEVESAHPTVTKMSELPPPELVVAGGKVYRSAQLNRQIAKMTKVVRAQKALLAVIASLE